MRAKLTKPTRYLTFTVLNLPRPPPPSSTPQQQQPYPLRLFTRYLQLFLTYLLSGLFHQTMDKAHGVPFRNGNVIRFFLMLAVGITVEDLVRWSFEKIFPSPQAQARQFWKNIAKGSQGDNENENENDGQNENSALKKALGYIWVFLFLSWTTPLWDYPRLRMEQQQRLLLKREGEGEEPQDMGLVRWIWRLVF